MIRTAKFDGSSTALTGFSVSGWFTRGDSSLSDDGSTVGVNTPRYAKPTLLLPAPALTEVRTPRPTQSWIWTGRWSDATACIVENWLDGLTWKLGVSVGSYSSNPTRQIDMGQSRTFPGIEPDWSHVPNAMVVTDGLILAFCTSFNAGIRKAVSCVRWNDDAAPLGQKFELVHRSASVQFQGNASLPFGHTRGAPWMASGPWVPPGGTDSNGNILDCFVAWVDYRANGVEDPDTKQVYGSTGGQLFLMRCTRASVSAAWQTGTPITLYEELFETAAGNRVAGYPFEGGSSMHFHSASVTFPSVASGPQPMVVTLSIGDSRSNNRMVNIARSDYTQYAQGWDSGSPNTPLAKNPYTGTQVGKWPVDVVTQNGWTTYEDREGQRAGWHTSRATQVGSATCVPSIHTATLSHDHGSSAPSATSTP